MYNLHSTAHNEQTNKADNDDSIPTGFLSIDKQQSNRDNNSSRIITAKIIIESSTVLYIHSIALRGELMDAEIARQHAERTSRNRSSTSGAKIACQPAEVA